MIRLWFEVFFGVILFAAGTLPIIAGADAFFTFLRKKYGEGAQVICGFLLMAAFVATFVVVLSAASPLAAS